MIDALFGGLNSLYNRLRKQMIAVFFVDDSDNIVTGPIGPMLP